YGRSAAEPHQHVPEEAIMRSTLIRVAGGSLLFVLSFAPDTFATSQCPESQVYCSRTGFTSTDPTFSHTCSPPGYFASGDYNIPAGTLDASISGRSSVTTSMNDVYTIVGLAPGTPVTFTAKLHVTGSLRDFHDPYCNSGGQAFLSDDS